MLRKRHLHAVAVGERFSTISFVVSYVLITIDLVVVVAAATLHNQHLMRYLIHTAFNVI